MIRSLGEARHVVDRVHCDIHQGAAEREERSVGTIPAKAIGPVVIRVRDVGEQADVGDGNVRRNDRDRRAVVLQHAIRRQGSNPNRLERVAGIGIREAGVEDSGGKRQSRILVRVRRDVGYNRRLFDKGHRWIGGATHVRIVGQDVGEIAAGNSALIRDRSRCSGIDSHCKFNEYGFPGRQRADGNWRCEMLHVHRAARNGSARLTRKRQTPLASGKEAIHHVALRLERIGVGQSKRVTDLVHNGGK